LGSAETGFTGEEDAVGGQAEGNEGVLRAGGRESGLDHYPALGCRTLPGVLWLPRRPESKSGVPGVRWFFFFVRTSSNKARPQQTSVVGGNAPDTRYRKILLHQPS
jgi:hypothetical protein